MGCISIGEKLGLKVPLQAFKGHSLDVYHKDEKAMLPKTHIFIPDQVAVVRMGTEEKPYTRFTAFADVDGNNINPI